MSHRPRKARRVEGAGSPLPQWSAGWESQEQATLEASLAATPAQRLEWLEEALEIAQASGALQRAALSRDEW